MTPPLVSFIEVNSDGSIDVCGLLCPREESTEGRIDLVRILVIDVRRRVELDFGDLCRGR